MSFHPTRCVAALCMAASLLLVLTPASLGAGNAAPDAPLTARIAAVIDGDTLVLDPPVSGSSRLRLAGIGAIKPPLGRPADRPWPLAAQARDALAALAEGATLRLEPAAQRIDRYGRLLAQAFLDDGRWLQGEMLRAGLARVSTTVGSRARAAEMLALEAEARAARRGLWASPIYAVRSPLEVRDDVGAFAVVEGAVVGAHRVKKRIYLNFGADWRDDFTVTIDTASLPQFGASGLDPLSLAGQRIRVRGWVERYNGPAIEATHPEQIEVLAPEAP